VKALPNSDSEAKETTADQSGGVEQILKLSHAEEF
jgi:hypothetical protein